MFNETEEFFPNYNTCPDVSDRCPVGATLYGDYFTTPACAIYAFAFAVMLITQAFFAGKGASWSFTIWLAIGTAMELIGYGARIVMSFNPWIFEAFLVQNMMLVLGPTFVAAATSVTFKYLIGWHGPEWSVVRPKLLPYIFVGSDMVSILVQSAGGGLSSIASGDDDMAGLLDIGSALMNGGVIFQVINMVICGGFMLVYMWRRHKSQAMANSHIDAATTQEWNQGVLRSKSERISRVQTRSMQSGPTERGRVHIFMWSLGIAYVAILARCIYRIPEMTMGWGSELQKNETTFLILDGGMMLLSTGLLTAFPPCIYFPFMVKEHVEVKQPDEEQPLVHELQPMR